MKLCARDILYFNPFLITSPRGGTPYPAYYLSQRRYFQPKFCRNIFHLSKKNFGRIVYCMRLNVHNAKRDYKELDNCLKVPSLIRLSR